MANVTRVDRSSDEFHSDEFIEYIFDVGTSNSGEHLKGRSEIASNNVSLFTLASVRQLFSRCEQVIL